MIKSDVRTVFDDYKFVTAAELDALGLTHLVGTPMLRAYMHGYFLDARLHAKARQLSEPFAFEEYRRNKLKVRISTLICILRIIRVTL